MREIIQNYEIEDFILLLMMLDSSQGGQGRPQSKFLSLSRKEFQIETERFSEAQLIYSSDSMHWRKVNSNSESHRLGLVGRFLSVMGRGGKWGWFLVSDAGGQLGEWLSAQLISVPPFQMVSRWSEGLSGFKTATSRSTWLPSQAEKGFYSSELFNIPRKLGGGYQGAVI